MQKVTLKQYESLKELKRVYKKSFDNVLIDGFVNENLNDEYSCLYSLNIKEICNIICKGFEYLDDKEEKIRYMHNIQKERYIEKSNLYYLGFCEGLEYFDEIIELRIIKK